MKPSRQTNALTAGVLALIASGSVHAASIMGPTQITATTDLPLYAPAYPVSALVDGITAENNALNGFAANVGSGLVTLTFDQAYDLSSFVLWNDVNVFMEGIKDFKLHFYDAGGDLISSTSTLTGPIGQLLPQTYTFDSTVLGVKSVGLDVASSNIGVVTHIEIRELAFNGVPAVPEPETWAMLAAGLGLMGITVRRQRKG
ncbi:MAG: PEP-CTERM sorting domain-containing protein [Betaproteobacteria bacterium]|nr:PEP-CTERM sorting domain-containing protein [Betaproteobacteria bacterium]